MRLAMFRTPGSAPRLAAVRGSELVDLNATHRAYLTDTGDDCDSDALIDALVPVTTEGYLRGGMRSRRAAEESLVWLAKQDGAAELTGTWGEPLVRPLADVTLCAPVMHPPKILCVGLNYRDHAEEQGAKIPRNPILFAKYQRSIVGPGEVVVHPDNTQALDYEAELAVVIGRRGRNIPVASAAAHVAGYCCFNDVTARDIQLADRQWLRGKMGDTHAPLGPWLVTPDEIQDVAALEISLRLNGEVLQSSALDQLIFGIDELVSFISETVTLEVGDIIATGTPGGVGFVRTPPVYMVPGDVVRMEISQLGYLENPIGRTP